VLLTVLTIVLLADITTGLGHWLEDAYCRRGIGGWLGTQVCDPNLKHHEDQYDFAKGSFIQRNYTTWLIAGSVALFAVAVGWYAIAAIACIAAMGNEVHAWSHRKPSHWFPRLLQECAIVQTPQQHAKHHRTPYTTHYCTLTNLCNPILDRLRVWRLLERGIEVVTTIPPNHRRLSHAATNH